MATKKLSEIAHAPAPPATTDTVIGVGSGTTDYQYTLAQLNFELFTSGSVPAFQGSPGTPFQVAFDGSGNLYICYAPNTWAKFSNVAPFGTQPGSVFTLQTQPQTVTQFRPKKWQIM